MGSIILPQKTLFAEVKLQALQLLGLAQLRTEHTTFLDNTLNGLQNHLRVGCYDQGREMARHKELTANTGIAVYFCDPHSPWQRGSNENINGLVRQYLPKGTDLSGYSQEQLDAIADEINNRTRKGLGVRTPLAVYRQLLLSHTEPQSSLVQ